jgi:hypothetical protein
MCTQTATIETTPAPFTVCALVQTHTTTSKCYAPNAEGVMTFTGDRTETREIGRIEFLAMGEWVLVCVRRSPVTGTGSAWEALSRADARAFYKAHLDGKGSYRGQWTAAEAVTRILGSREMPAVRDYYSWGDVGYMYTLVDFPTMTCPVIDMSHGRKCALRPFKYTTPPTPGDRYSHNRTAIQFTEVRDAG